MSPHGVVAFADSFARLRDVRSQACAPDGLLVRRLVRAAYACDNALALSDHLPSPEARAGREGPLLSVSGLTVSFGDNAVLRGVELTVARGEILSLLGPSGCGKSVLLKVIVGLMRPTAGAVMFDGADVATLDAAGLLELRHRVGMVFQSGALFDSLSVGDNVGYGLMQGGALALDGEALATRVDWALRAVGLPDTAHLMPAELSGGMRKRVAVARTIALRPEMILYDEPTMGLDPINSGRIGRLIARLNHDLGITSLVVTHDIHLALTISDRMALMLDGVIAALGTPDAMQHSADGRVRDFLTGHVAPT